MHGFIIVYNYDVRKYFNRKISQKLEIFFLIMHEKYIFLHQKLKNTQKSIE